MTMRCRGSRRGGSHVIGKVVDGDVQVARLNDRHDVMNGDGGGEVAVVLLQLARHDLIVPWAEPVHALQEGGGGRRVSSRGLEVGLAAGSLT